MHTPLVWSLELGRKLRELRQRAGLTQPELTHLTGKRPGGQSLVSRLEQGRVRYPSLALLADYLRACRASFAELVPLLDRYTNRPPVRESRARETALSGLAGDPSRDALRLDVYDRKTEAARERAGQRPVPPAKRAAALARQLAARKRYRALDRAVLDEAERLGVRPTLVVQTLALDYARMVWKALEKTEADPSQKSKAKTQKVKRQKDGGEEDRRFFGEPQNDRQGTVIRTGRGRPRKTRAERLRDAEARMRKLVGPYLSVKALRQIARRVRREYEERPR